VVNELLRRGLLLLPILIGDPDFPIIQYADNTLLIVPADKDQLAALKVALEDFSASNGLAINFHKSCMLPTNLYDEDVSALAADFGCVVGTMPFTYLCLSLGTTRPRMQDPLPLVDRVERGLMASSSFLAYGGRLQLIRSCLSSMPIFLLCSLSIPPGIITQLNRIIRQCLWRKKQGESTASQSFAYWVMICKPKTKGGLGILDFKKPNEALLIKHQHKIFNKQNIPWVKLVWNY
jgi:hypothetical protein